MNGLSVVMSWINMQIYINLLQILFGRSRKQTWWKLFITDLKAVHEHIDLSPADLEAPELSLFEHSWFFSWNNVKSLTF